MQIKSKKGWELLCTVLLCIGPVFGAAVYCMLEKKAAADIFSNIIFSILLIGAYHTFLSVNEKHFYHKIAHPVLYAGIFVLAFLMLGIGVKLPTGLLWMLAVVIAALDAGLEIAVPTYVVLMVQYAFMILPNEEGFYRFSGYLLMGIIIAVLFSMLRKTEVVGYLAVILAACDGIIQFIAYQFNLQMMKRHGADIAAELVSALLLAAAGWLYLKSCKNPQEAESTENVESAESAENAERSRLTQQEETLEVQEDAALEVLTAPDFELLKRLQEYSASLFAHSNKIADLSEKAAALIGADALLAKAGGLYHEIGRIADETDYIEAGTGLGQEYHFPERLLAVMRQHSTGFEFPQSAEAAIVMLSDCIISTSEYLEKAGKRSMVSDEHLVRSIFQNRLEKGNLEESGITPEQLQRLREFFVAYTFVKEG